MCAPIDIPRSARCTSSTADKNIVIPFGTSGRSHWPPFFCSFLSPAGRLWASLCWLQYYAINHCSRRSARPLAGERVSLPARIGTGEDMGRSRAAPRLPTGDWLTVQTFRLARCAINFAQKALELVRLLLVLCLWLFVGARLFARSFVLSLSSWKEMEKCHFGAGLPHGASGKTKVARQVKQAAGPTKAQAVPVNRIFHCWPARSRDGQRDFFLFLFLFRLRRPAGPPARPPVCLSVRPLSATL